MYVAVWLHWFMAAFFVLAGLWFFAKRSCFGVVDPFCRNVDAYDDASEQRLAAAYERRARRERDFGGAPGIALAGLAFVLAALAATTTVAVATLYAVFVASIAAVIAVTTGPTRRSHRRAASLAVRERNDGVPALIVLLVGVAALTPLTWATKAPVPAIAVAFAGLVMYALGLRVAFQPAELEGDDTVVEAFVDRRIRGARVAQLLANAPAPAFVFASFSNWTDSPVHVTALAIAFTACATTGWHLVISIRKPSPADLAAWLHVAP